MHIYKLSLIVAAVILSFTANATTYKFVAGNNSIDTKICIKAAENNLAKYKKIVASWSFSHRVLANELTCNDENIANFAAKYGAIKTALFINNYKYRFRKMKMDTKVTITDLVNTPSAKPINIDDVVIVTVN